MSQKIRGKFLQIYEAYVYGTLEELAFQGTFVFGFLLLRHYTGSGHLCHC